jgi:cytochrome b561
LIHWLPAVVFALPWYIPVDPELTQQGFLQSLFAVTGFSVGVLLLARLLRVFDSSRKTDQIDIRIKSNPSVARSYLIVGSIAFL